VVKSTCAADWMMAETPHARNATTACATPVDRALATGKLNLSKAGQWQRRSQSKRAVQVEAKVLHMGEPG
jgi:hypothetical protein